MSLPARAPPRARNNSVFTYTQSQPSFPPNLVRTSADSRPSTPIIPPSVNVIPSTGTNSIHEHTQVSSRPIVCDLPIARKASLHRFLEREKDRIASKAPYQLTNPMEPANKPAEIHAMVWVGC
ncbi:CO/COL/TOC1, conserved site [Sesbania bispinosa]|nr:CO/COL/TOC1, conserved site [Sesbania bispinosa]